MSFKRKLAGTATAAVMLCSLFGGQAFAAAPTGAADGSLLQIEKVLYTDGNGHMAPDAQFSFKIAPLTVPKDTRQDGLEVKEGKPLTGADQITSKKFTNGESATNTDGKWSISDKTASFDFSTAGFDKQAAIYRYKVTENAVTQAAIQGDNTAYQLDVYVNNEGNVTALVAKRLNEQGVAGEKAPIRFENTYSTEDLTIEKHVTGTTGEKGRDFHFTLKIEASDCLKDGAQIVTSKHSGNAAKDDITLTVGQEANFTLKDGESLALTDLPKDTKYVLKETEANTENYTTTVTGDNTQKLDDSGNFIIMDGANKVTFTNDRNEITPTGIILNVAPYAAAALLAIAAALLFFVKRRNSHAR